MFMDTSGFSEKQNVYVEILCDHVLGMKTISMSAMEEAWEEDSRVAAWKHGRHGRRHVWRLGSHEEAWVAWED